MAANIPGGRSSSPPILLYWANLLSIGCGITFLVLAALTSIVPVIPFLSDLARHGKRMISSDQKRNGVKSLIMKNHEFSSLLSVPKSYFAHMYTVGLICGLFSSVAAFCNICPSSSGCSVSDIFCSTALQGLLMFEMQCLRRLFECLYMTEYGSSVMDVSAYLVGLLHYVLVPSCILSSLLYYDSSSPNARIILRLFSLSIYLLGNVCQFLCHRTLFNIKKGNIVKSKLATHDQSDKYGKMMASSNDCISCYDKDEKSKKLTKGDEMECNTVAKQKSIDGSKSKLYSFPRGFGFDYVGCPHYTAEIAIYFSFFLLQPTSIPLFCMLLWVIANLSVVADSQYKWYLENFPEDVKRIRGWKRLLPCVW